MSAPLATGTDWLYRYAAENVGGAVSGSVSIILGHPFDTVKVRLQAGHSQYSGAVECIRKTVQAEGARALFKGMMSPLLANSALNAVTFSTWQEAQRFLHFQEGSKAPLEKVFLAGAIAGVVQCSIGTPMELVRSRLQVHHHIGGGYVECIRQLYRSEGLAGIYRGNVSMMAREGPAFGVYFSMYEATKRSLCPSLEEGETEPMWVQACGGAVTGAATWAAVMPMDVISTRIQCMPDEQVSDRSRRSVLGVSRQIWSEGGILAFYKGLGTAVVRGIALNAVVFPVYEATVQVFS